MSKDLSVEILKLSNIGFNPITKGEENVTEWLKDQNNIVFSVKGNNTPLCFSRDSFDPNILQLNHILYKCDKNDSKYAKQIIKNESNTFLDLGKFNIIDGTATNLEKFSKILSKGQTFSVKENPEIGLSLFNGEMRLKMNDFYATFLEYSGDSLYLHITYHLLSGDDLTIDEMKHMAIIDQFFMEHATRTTDNKTKLYRGMDSPYPIAEGESMTVRNYISTTTSLESEGEKRNGGVTTFIDENYYRRNKRTIMEKPPHLPDNLNNCCAYELTLDKDIPYIDMEHSTEIEAEREILLPRNLLITLTGEYISESNIHVRQLRVSKTTENQFDIIPKNRCTKFGYADVDVAIIEFVNSSGGCRKSRHQKNKNTSKNKTKKITTKKFTTKKALQY